MRFIERAAILTAAVLCWQLPDFADDKNHGRAITPPIHPRTH